MSRQTDPCRLTAMLHACGATELHARMAATLLTLNGLESALAFAAKIPTFSADSQPPEQWAAEQVPCRCGGDADCWKCGGKGFTLAARLKPAR